jgi:hypothetical protein
MKRRVAQAYVDQEVRDRVHALRIARRPIPSESAILGEAILHGLPIIEAAEKASDKAARK